jgi:hypothetical protein
VTRIPIPPSRQHRLDLEGEIGQPLFVLDQFAYASGDVDLVGGSRHELPCDFEPRLHVWDLRSAFATTAIRRGFDAWFGFGGEIAVVGFPDALEVDGIRVRPRLRVRMEEDGSDLPLIRLVGRRDTRWLVRGSLADAPAPARAEGERAVRVAGDGPRTGEIVRLRPDVATIRAGANEFDVSPGDYALAAPYGYVLRNHGSETLRRLQIASGSLTSSGQRNRYAVKDRFVGLAACFDALGWAFELPNEGRAVISSEWTEIRVQEGP